MSDEESFVILGSSPMSSLENDGLEAKQYSAYSSSSSDTPGSRFISLKSSQISVLKNAQEIETQTAIQPEMGDVVMTPKANTQVLQDKKQEEMAASKLWSRPPQVQLVQDITKLSLEDCALKSPLEIQHQQKEEDVIKPKALMSVNSKEKTTPPHSSIESNLAASFIMGEVNSDVLKTSVYSQFPSISMEACAEDVVKLQNMVTDYAQLKATIKKANNTMKLFYNNSLQSKEKMKAIEEQYKDQLYDCKKEIEELRKQNKEMENNFKMQIEALEIARQKDREETIQEISEKNAILENMRMQIIKLEQQQLVSFEFVPQKQANQPPSEQLSKFYITHQEHDNKIKSLQRELSEMLASNLSLKDVEKQYIDELNCLKVNLTAAEELLKTNSAEIAQLRAQNIESQQQIEKLETSLKSLHLAYEEQKERILLLETQNQVHRKDFEIEKEGRESLAKEKQQVLQDLRSLQRKNHELIEEHQKMAESYQRRMSTSSNNDAQITAASAAAQTFFNNPQRPIRVSNVLPSPSTSAATPPAATNMCPICNKGFRSLCLLLSHVNDCVDKN